MVDFDRTTKYARSKFSQKLDKKPQRTLDDFSE